MTMVPTRWTPAFKSLISDPYVNEEFKRLAAVLNSALAGQTTGESEAGLDNGNPINTLPIDDSGKGDQAIRWLIGPWLFGPNGNAANNAVLRPPMITSDVHNYSPLGIFDAIGLELTSDVANRRITGISSSIRTSSGFAKARRMLFVFNAGAYDLIFPHNTSESVQSFSFGLGTTGDVLVLPPGRVVWFYYDSGTTNPSGGTENAFWRLFALPAVAASGLPTSLQSPSFPPDYDWFGARIINSGTGAAAIGIGEATPTINGSTFAGDNQTTGMFEQCITAAGAGGSAGMVAASANQLQPQQDPTWITVLRTGASITGVRIWVLFSNAAGSDADDQGGVTAYFGFRYSTVAGDAGWVGVTRDGATQTVTGTVANIAVSTTYKLKVRKSGSTIYFSVNGGVEIAKTTNLPSGTTTLQWFAKIWTQDANAKSLSWSRHSVKFGIAA